MKKANRKNKFNNKRVIIFLSVIALFIIVIIIGSVIVNNEERKKAESIDFKFSDNYEYFDISVEDFYLKISYELKEKNIKTKELKSINYDDVYNLYYEPYCDWNYAIDLSNNDRILLCSNNKGKTITSIGYDFSESKNNENAGFFTGKISKLFHLSDFDKEDFVKNVGNDFFDKEETYDFSAGSNARYVYNHILYGMDTIEGANADGSIDENSKYIFVIFAPVKETNNKEWKENFAKEWEENYEKEQENDIKNELGTNENNANQGTKNTSSDSTITYGYEKIYNDYSSRLKNECPNLSVTECAEISNEGIIKMAEYMKSATGTDGQYATYEKWAGKLMDVYMQEAR